MVTRHAGGILEKDLNSAIETLDSLTNDNDQREKAMETVSDCLLHTNSEIKLAASKKVTEMFLHPKIDTLQTIEASQIVLKATKKAESISDLTDLLKITRFVDRSIENTRKEARAVEVKIIEEIALLSKMGKLRV